MTDTSSEDHSEPWGTYRPNGLQRVLIALTQNTILQRGAFRGGMTRAIMALGAPLDITFRDCCFRIEGRNNLIETGLLTRPGYNAPEIDFLGQVVTDGGVAVDIGSNVGLYSLPLARAAGPTGRVLAIDANPSMTRHLAFHAKASGLANLTSLHMAVGGKEARVDLRIRLDDVAIVRVEESATGSVRMLPLTTILSEAGIERIDALKIDIEGHEDAALVPFLKQAPDPMLPARIVIERAGPDGDYPGCVAEFSRLGYRRVGQTRNNSMYERG
ncbi:MAG: FkbM family methyltransferase [Jannaschia sp.]